MVSSRPATAWWARQVRLHPESAKIVYEDSKAAYESVSNALEGFRSNVTKVLALATAAATFFAFEDSNKGWLFYAAIVTYSLSVLVAGLLYRPIRWATNVAKHAPAALRAQGDRLPPAKVHYDLACRYQKAQEENLDQINRTWGVSDKYQVMLALVGITVLMMLVNTAQEAPEVAEEPIRVIVEQE